MPIVVHVTYQAQPGMHDVAAREIAALVEAVTATEPACLGITVLRSDGEEGRFLLHERWTDRETYVGPHMQTPHLQGFIERAGGFLAGPPDITVWQEA